MNNIDLWDDEIFKELLEDEEMPVKASASPKHILKGRDAEVQIDSAFINVFTLIELPQIDVENLLQSELNTGEGFYHYHVKLSPVNAFILRHLLRRYKVIIEKDSAKELTEYANKVQAPTATLTEDKKHVQVKFPNIKSYREIVEKVGAYPTSEGHRVNLTKVLDLEGFSESMEANLPKIRFDKDVLMLNREPLLGFDGTLPSMKDLPLSLLNIVSANGQSWKALKASKETVEEKMNKMGINNLYDLMFWLPRRYIDKSNPQDLVDLIIGETAVVVGEIEKTLEINSDRGGAIFIIKLDNEKTVRATFFNQKWLLNKFKVGQEVLVTGKFSWWNDSPQIGGASIEHAEEAALLPIVPVYNQSPSKGITTHLIMSANRELLARIGDISLPTYFRQKGRMDYCEALSELHFPTSLTKHSEAINDLAYYELVYMQLIIQEAKESSDMRQGIQLSEAPQKLQGKAIKSLPFDLTTSQKRALVVLNKKMDNDVPSSTLLNADVGSGKGILEDEKVLTPYGWRKIKNIKVGDEVIGSNGKPTTVTGVYPQGLQEVAKIDFSDKTSIITDLSHLWAVNPMGQFAAKYKDGILPTRIVSTRQLLSKETSEVEIEQDGKYNSVYKKKVKMQTYFKTTKDNLKWSIPVLSEPVEYRENVSLPMNPYVLGYWLGNGTSISLDISVGGEDVDETEQNLKEVWDGSVARNTRITLKNRTAHLLKLKSQDFAGATKLREMDLYKNKHIPKEYFISSPEDRIALLQGLMDSDGHSSKRGNLEFTNNNKAIIDGLLDLVRSLGGIGKISRARKAKYRNSEGNIVKSKYLSYTVIFTLPFGIQPFRLSRKMKRYEERLIALPKRSHGHKKAITNVELLPEKQKTICIKIDAEDELFVTKDYIVTHNTLVAQLSSLKAVDGGFQAALIAPTDILARQLFSSFKRLSEGLESEYGNEINIELYSGAMKAAEKKEILKKVADGTVDILVGTHSLMTSVKYRNLGYVVIDEQQKFGAEQRSALLNSREDGRIPDLLMMTATPIPRSTAQVIYGDVDMVELAEKPPGRLPIETEWIEQDPEQIIEELANPLWKDIIEECQKGNQAFIITPLVSESEKIDSASAERTFQKLSELALSGLNVGIVHGQLKQDKQAEVMEKFKKKEYDVLIASTVVEVGVDIPDATRVVILSADRLGSSSLHQIRGRVGRNSKPSKCYLVSLGRTDNSRARLESLVESENGFDIAKADLELRGEGKMFSVEQSGRTELMFATLGKHQKDIQQAKEDAIRILGSPFRKQALKDSKERFQADERLM